MEPPTTELLRKVRDQLRQQPGWTIEGFHAMSCATERVNELLGMWADWIEAPPRTPEEREKCWRLGTLLSQISFVDGTVLPFWDSAALLSP